MKCVIFSQDTIAGKHTTNIMLNSYLMHAPTSPQQIPRMCKIVLGNKAFLILILILILSAVFLTLNGLHDRIPYRGENTS